MTTETDEAPGLVALIFSCICCGTTEGGRVLASLGPFCHRCHQKGEDEPKLGRYTEAEQAALIDIAVASGWEHPWQVNLWQREVWRAARGRTLKGATTALKRLLERKSLEPWRWADPEGAELLDYGRLAEVRA
jgi:hypothetical protein